MSTMHTHHFKDKTILVTGASSGIGAQVAILLASYGANVVMLAKSLKKLDAVYDYINEQGFTLPYVMQVDYLKLTDAIIVDIQTKMTQEFGKLDGLCHIAGFLGVLCPIEHYAPDIWFKVMQVHVNAPFLLTQALLPLLKKSDHSSIVFTESYSTTHPRANFGAYTVAAHAARALRMTLQEELSGYGIRVQSVLPSPTRSALRANAFPAENPIDLSCPSDAAPYYIEALMSAESGRAFVMENTKDYVAL